MDFNLENILPWRHLQLKNIYRVWCVGIFNTRKSIELTYECFSLK